jgi:DNA repair protein RadC
MTSSINSLFEYEKPREKALRSGVGSMTDVELLALILGSGGKDNSVIGLSRKLLKEFGGLKGLSKLSINELTNIKDIGISKATKLKASFEISLRITSFDETNIKISGPEEVAMLVKRDLYGKEKEYLYMLCLNTRGNLIKKELVSVGTVNESLIDPREIFRLAIKNNSTSIILVHNHPSNDPEPSTEDILATKRIYEVGKKVGISLLDHIIYCNSKHISLKQMNVINKDVHS